MRLPQIFVDVLVWAAERVTHNFPPSMIIGGADDPYLLRWYLIPRNRFFNVYLHEFHRSDDDRALHDHPWCSMSLVLTTGYWEHLEDAVIWRWAGSVLFRSATLAHRIALGAKYHGEGLPLTIFITGPKIRDWGFHCPKGWIPWWEFVSGADKGVPGKGCGET